MNAVAFQKWLFGVHSRDDRGPRRWGARHHGHVAVDRESVVGHVLEQAVLDRRPGALGDALEAVCGGTQQRSVPRTVRPGATPDANADVPVCARPGCRGFEQGEAVGVEDRDVLDEHLGAFRVSQHHREGPAEGDQVSALDLVDRVVHLDQEPARADTRHRAAVHVVAAPFELEPVGVEDVRRRIRREPAGLLQVRIAGLTSKRYDFSDTSTTVPWVVGGTAVVIVAPRNAHCGTPRTRLRRWRCRSVPGSRRRRRWTGHSSSAGGD